MPYCLIVFFCFPLTIWSSLLLIGCSWSLQDSSVRQVELWVWQWNSGNSTLLTSTGCAPDVPEYSWGAAVLPGKADRDIGQMMVLRQHCASHLYELYPRWSWQAGNYWEGSNLDVLGAQKAFLEMQTEPWASTQLTSTSFVPYGHYSSYFFPLTIKWRIFYSFLPHLVNFISQMCNKVTFRRNNYFRLCFNSYIEEDKIQLLIRL